MGIHVTALDSVEATRWSYMAAVLAEALQEAGISRAISADAVPVAVWASARRFFQLALSVAEGPSTGNFHASVANYRIAADALRASSDKPVGPREELERQIQAFANFRYLPTLPAAVAEILDHARPDR